MTDTPFDINIATGFESVADTFKANFEEGGELGAQFFVLKDGEPIVDCKGGWADKGKTTAMNSDSLISVYSSGKAMAALVIAWLVDQDRIGYDQTVSSLWPEFGTNGKDKVTIAELMSHQAGLSGFSNPEWSREDWFDWNKACAELAGQAPLYTPGEACGYHPVTFGILAGEVTRLADEEGRTLGQILREEFCGPQNIDVWIGLPDAEHDRCSDMVRPKRLPKFGTPNPALNAAFFTKGASADTSDLARWRRVELAGSNCQATAKGMATMMQVFNTGRLGDIVMLAPDTLARLCEPRISAPNLVLPFDLTFAAGVMLNEPNFFFGPNARTVGHSGWGGSCVFADSESGLTGCYAMNRQENSLLGDSRSVRLIDAVYSCL